MKMFHKKKWSKKKYINRLKIIQVTVPDIHLCYEYNIWIIDHYKRQYLKHARVITALYNHVKFNPG